MSIDLKTRIVICWQCESQVIAEEDWKEVRCPICRNINFIPEKRPNIDLNINSVSVVPYLNVMCPFCQHQMKTRRESDYIICSKCKNTIVIMKTDSNDLDHLDHKLKQIKLFNPYARNDNFGLKQNFEMSLKDAYEEMKQDKEFTKNSNESKNELKETKEYSYEVNKNKIKRNNFEVYKPLIETINEINDRINKLDFTKKGKGL